MRREQDFNLNAVWLLIGINLLLFLATSIQPNLQETLGLQRASFTEEPWKIVTNLFIHANIWHILANMLTLYFFGTYLLRLVGENKFLIVYFLGGIVGNAFYMLLGDPYATVIGASGAIFAVGGALTVLRPNLRVLVLPIPIPLPLWVAVIGGFFIISLVPNVAWQAHLGGLLFGLLAGYFFKKKRRRFF
jgi:membrane associated rhomboid family serine protease